MQSLLWTLTAPKTISLTQAGVTSFFILGRTVKTKTSTERPWCQRCTPFLGGARGRQIVRFWTSLRAVSLWQKRWGIWDRHGWKALKELYYICQHRFSQWNLQTLTIVSNFILFISQKKNFFFIRKTLFQAFLSSLRELDRENSTSHLFALGIPKLKNVSLKNSFRVITTISTCPCSL